MLERGFLGTSASLLSDLSLSLGVLVALTLSVGVVMARRKKIEAHRWIQSVAVALNVLQVVVVMVGSFMKSAAPGVPSRVGEPYFAIAIVHGLVGLGTLLLGVFIALRANELLPPFLHRLRFHNFKLFMRTAYGLYMLSTALGVAVYLVWYSPGRPVESPRLAAAADEVVIPMANFEFSPREIIVPVGSTIIWLNQDAAPHTATADDGRAFNSDLVANGQSFSLTLLDVGEFSYFCELHGSAGGIGMAGKISVVAGDQAPSASVAAPPPLLPSDSDSGTDAERKCVGTAERGRHIRQPAARRRARIAKHAGVRRRSAPRDTGVGAARSTAHRL
jgi:plastocyanin